VAEDFGIMGAEHVRSKYSAMGLLLAEHELPVVAQSAADKGNHIQMCGLQADLFWNEESQGLLLTA
jgi:hypothetical protein